MIKPSDLVLNFEQIDKNSVHHLKDEVRTIGATSYLYVCI